MLFARGIKIISTMSLALTVMAGAAQAAQCGNTSGGFEAWKQQFSAEAKEGFFFMNYVLMISVFNMVGRFFWT